MKLLLQTPEQRDAAENLYHAEGKQAGLRLAMEEFRKRAAAAFVAHKDEAAYSLRATVGPLRLLEHMVEREIRTCRVAVEYADCDARKRSEEETGV